MSLEPVSRVIQELFDSITALLGGASPPLSRHPRSHRLSHARTGSSPPLVDGRLKCRRHADRSRIPDSHEPSLKTTLGHRLLRLRLSGNRQNDSVLTPTVS